ncbi:hypothetical protein ACH5RR_026230 [Cinchona calisaya]|uniref:RNase H type-1 domain-containing protein n=1 Tax=Cinchona calisaya TaxID=153742 RepID=A0ABD2Z711_9GENT
MLSGIALTPRSGVIKLNIDATILKQNGKTCIDVVARASRGNLVANWSTSWLGCFDGKLSETLAIRFSFVQAQKKSWRSIQEESDVLNVISKLQ